MRRKKPAEILRTSIQYFETHENLTRGDRVKVQGERGRWEFRAYCVNADTGSEWVDVFGGAPGYETLRAFTMSRITPVRKRASR